MEYTPEEIELLKNLIKNSHLAATKFCFKVRENQKLIVNQHHKILCRFFDDIYKGKITRGIINIPPGYTKTEAAVITNVARGLLVNPKSRYIHTSFSDPLVLDNSLKIKDTLFSEEYQKLFPVELRKDSSAKGLWRTSEGGVFLAAPSGGTITGFRAGYMDEGFTGMLIVDDPLKPEDANSKAIRERINDRVNNTFKSRLAHPKVPIVIIMQRLHEEDTTAYLLKGGTGETWDHLCLPAIIDRKKSYPIEYTHGREYKHDIPDGVLWKYKQPMNTLKELEKSDPYVFSAQYMQEPTPAGGTIFKPEWFKYYTDLPPFEYKIIVGDTAQKTGEHNDYSVFQCWGKSGTDIYLIDQIRGKWEAHTLKQMFLAFWEKHYGTGAQTYGKLKTAYIEDKVSGTGLIQELKTVHKIPIQAIQRYKDKLTRAHDTVPFLTTGRVYLPGNAKFLPDYVSEFKSFNGKMTHLHDDQVDPTMDAVEKLIGLKKVSIGSW